MEESPPRNRFSQPSNSRFSTKKGKSGYEPSDTETEWQETPRHERERKALTLVPGEGTKALAPLDQRHSSRFENEISSQRRQHSKSPYEPQRGEDSDDDASSPLEGFNTRRNISPLPKPGLGKNASPYKPEREKHLNKSMTLEEKHERRAPSKEKRRAVTAPRLRLREKEKENNNYGEALQKGGRTMSPFSKEMNVIHLRAPSVGEINEIVVKENLSNNLTCELSLIESTDSISIQPGDIFFSRECNALQTQKKNSLVKSIQQCRVFSPTLMRGNGNLNANIRGNSSSNVLSQSTTGSGIATTSRKGSAHGTGKLSASNSVMSGISGKTTESMRKFTANRKKNQTQACFACMRKGSCNTSRKSPEHRSIDEASFIDRALVVESLPQFWADKHQPASLNGFICNKQEAQLLKELVSQGRCPHILLKGPSGSGKKALAIAFLREIYGDACWNLSHDLRHFPIQERRPMKISVPVTSSSHHMELNVNLEPDAKYALMGLVKEISSEYAVAPEVSNMNFKSDYKVIVLYEVDKAAQNIQHMVKWIIDRYSDICKLVLCCEDDAEILEIVKNWFEVIKVDAPLTQEIAEVLIQISKEEDINLSKNFAVKIATKSKQNLRKAIMALEACKAHNYPFSEDQPIPIGWEEILIEVAAEILLHPSNSRLFSIRGKLQKLLVDFVHPKLILQKLVEQLLKRVEASLKRELYYWHAYYDKRLPRGTTALLKLEEFVAKFMSIYRKSSSNRQHVLVDMDVTAG